jgi:hypothetical protein
VPHFRRPNVNRAASLAWTRTPRISTPRRDKAAESMFAKHAAERAARRSAAE